MSRLAVATVDNGVRRQGLADKMFYRPSWAPNVISVVNYRPNSGISGIKLFDCQENWAQEYDDSSGNSFSVGLVNLGNKSNICARLGNEVKLFEPLQLGGYLDSVQKKISGLAKEFFVLNYDKHHA